MSATNNDTMELQETVTPQETKSFLSGGWVSFVPMLLIFAVFYFLTIRPQEKKRRQQEELVNSVKRGEQIITHAGIYGTVVEVNKDSSVVEVEIAKGINIKISKNGIADIITRKEGGKQQAKGKK